MDSLANTKWVHVRLVFALAICAAFLCSPVLAQQSLERMLEPTRFALVIGNAAYGEHGNLPTLGSPCSDDEKVDSDTKVVAEALRDARWSVEVECDLKTDQLEKKIRNFNDRVRREPRAFGIIYFSGHGAEVAGTNYLFGVDADIKEKVEVDTYRQNPNALLFGGSAVPLDEAMRQVQPLWGKAVAVFVDACRTNPVLHKLRAEGLDLVRYPAKASEPYNILYTFSTVAGEPSPDGGLGGVSRYARILSKVVRAQTATQQDELELLVSAIGKGVILDSRRSQITGRAGSILRPPRFCIRGCPTLEEEWKSFQEEFGPRPPTSPSVALVSRQAIPGNVDTFNRLINTPGFWSIYSNEMQVAEAASDLAPVSLQVATDSPSVAVLPTRRMRIDVIYCSGDPLTELRRLKSEGISEHLKRYTGTDTPVAGFEVGEVRLIPVPPGVNQVLYKSRDTVLTYNRDSPAQQDWAAVLQSSLGVQLRIDEKPGGAPDYMTILVCDGATPAVAGPTIYVHAATEEQMPKAMALSAELAQQLPNSRVAKGIEVVKTSPNRPEIRYFSRNEAIDAAAVAKIAESLLSRKVAARFVPGYDGKLNGARLVEVWIGQTEGP